MVFTSFVLIMGLFTVSAVFYLLAYGDYSELYSFSGCLCISFYILPAFV